MAGGMVQRGGYPAGRRPSQYGGQTARFPEENAPIQVQAAPESQEGIPLLHGGVRTWEAPITEFPADIVIGPNENKLLVSGGELPALCVGFRVVNLIPGAAVSINSGGPRTLLNGDSVTGAEIRSIQVVTDSTGSLVLQAIGAEVR